jgi:hypothetical protein
MISDVAWYLVLDAQRVVGRDATRRRTRTRPKAQESGRDQRGRTVFDFILHHLILYAFSPLLLAAERGNPGRELSEETREGRKISNRRGGGFICPIPSSILCKLRMVS